MAFLHAAYNALWAISRGVRAWFHCWPSNRGSFRALRSSVRAWWRHRDGRRYIVRAERVHGLTDRWHP